MTLKPPVPPAVIVTALGITQILAWGSSYYLPAVLAKPIADDTGWPLSWVVGGLSLGLLVAGLASPSVGRFIHRQGGRPVLAASAVLIAAGQVGLAVAPNLPLFILAWIIMGLGMSAGLYDAAFSTLGRLYREHARHHIATLTLFGGFASTTCWPLSAFLMEHVGWRNTCFAYAAVQIFISLPIYLFALPCNGQVVKPDAAAKTEQAKSLHAPGIFMLLAIAIMIGSMISTVISVHLLTILRDRGLTLAAAVALGTLVGPSQVGARFIEMLIARYHHPIWTKVASVSLVAAGLTLLSLHFPMVFLTLIFYGGGIGLESIARATLPLALFGPEDYAPIMGKLARPSLIAQAASPSIGAFLIERMGPDSALNVVAAVAAFNVALTVALFIVTHKARRHVLT
ncbi:MAG TPA: MFS transporter [Terriglobia bacterium]|nr:MFS transporter [Terriglobia bacterium]